MKKTGLFLLFISFVFTANAQDKDKDKKDKGLPLKAERFIEIKSNKGTWMSLDVHPKGTHIVFDFDIFPDLIMAVDDVSSVFYKLTLKC